MSQYPECEKVKAVQAKSQAIGEFIDWLENEKQIYLMKGRKPIHQTTLRLIAEFFDIDLEKVEQEKQSILAEIRSTLP